jgi:hypothetical protein
MDTDEKGPFNPDSESGQRCKEAKTEKIFAMRLVNLTQFSEDLFAQKRRRREQEKTFARR